MDFRIPCFPCAVATLLTYNRSSTSHTGPMGDSSWRTLSNIHTEGNRDAFRSGIPNFLFNLKWFSSVRAERQRQSSLNAAMKF